jgi:hypothetical protein
MIAVKRKRHNFTDFLEKERISSSDAQKSRQQLGIAKKHLDTLLSTVITAAPL